jgi:hypothetical protein
MGDGVAPIIQVPETGQPDRVRWVGPCEIDQEAEASEVLADVLDSRVSGVRGRSRIPKRAHRKGA